MGPTETLANYIVEANHENFPEKVRLQGKHLHIVTSYFLIYKLTVTYTYSTRKRVLINF